ncbi:hypothetical protein BvCmsNSP049_01213 [Escherichia coli]|nr:hypothetical protein BvCmsNSP049_01213 [Escherichia coli]
MSQRKNLRPEMIYCLTLVKVSGEICFCLPKNTRSVVLTQAMIFPPLIVMQNAFYASNLYPKQLTECYASMSLLMMIYLNY